jgi:hypothetical protein
MPKTVSPPQMLMLQIQEEPVEEPKFEIRSVNSNADVEDVRAEGEAGERPVLHRWVEIIVRFQKGFDWNGPEVKALLKKLQRAEELNDE